MLRSLPRCSDTVRGFDGRLIRLAAFLGVLARGLLVGRVVFRGRAVLRGPCFRGDRAVLRAVCFRGAAFVGFLGADLVFRGAERVVFLGVAVFRGFDFGAFTEVFLAGRVMLPGAFMRVVFFFVLVTMSSPVVRAIR